jgi:hypothetical protein
MNGSGLNRFRCVDRFRSVNGSRRLVSVDPPDGAGVLRNAEHAFDAASDTSGNSAHRSADRAADRTGRAIADGGTLFGSAHDPLRLHRHRRSEDREANGGKENGCSHGNPPSNLSAGSTDKRAREFLA